MGVAGSDADHLDDEQKRMEADALSVLDIDMMTKIQKKVVLAELDALQAALKEVDAAFESEAARNAISSKSLGPNWHHRLMGSIRGSISSSIAPSPQVLPEGSMPVTQNVDPPDPKLLEARKAMPSTVAVSKKEHKATLQRLATPFRGLLRIDDPLRKALADHFKKVCLCAQHAASRFPKACTLHCRHSIQRGPSSLSTAPFLGAPGGLLLKVQLTLSPIPLVSNTAPCAGHRGCFQRI